MRGLKKVLLAVLVISLLLTSTVFAAPAFSDIEGTPYQEAIEVLAALKILEGYDEGDFRPDETITRAELTAVVTRMKGLDILVESNAGITNFTDVAEDHWAVKNIAVAQEMGLISGFGDGTFKPDDPVTYEQAVRMVVSAAGYTPLANSEGGYPFGYIFVASTTGIDEGVSPVASGEPATRGTVAQLAFNAMGVDMMEVTSVGGSLGGVTSTVIPGKTLFSEVFKVTKGTGILEGYGATKIYQSVGQFRDDEAYISKALFKTGDLDLNDLVGYTVDYYSRYDAITETNTLVYVKAADDQTVIECTPESVGTISGLGSTSTSYTYMEDANSDPRTLNILPEFTMVYNNQVLDTKDRKAEYFDINSGSIKWFDSNNDNYYDLAVIKSYKTYGVASVSASSNIITLRSNNDNRSQLNFSTLVNDPSFKVSYIYDGGSAEITDISANNVLSVAESLDGMSYEIVISDQSISGSVQQSSQNVAGEMQYTIEGETYTVAPECRDTISLGYEGDFYISFDGKIAFVEASVDASMYGYLLTAAADTEGMANTVLVEILTTDNERKIFELKDRVRVNGTMVDALDALPTLQNRSLVTYQTDSEERVTKINTPGKAPQSDPLYLSDGTYFDNIIYRPGSPTGSFKGQFYIETAKVAIFQVPGGRDQASTLDKEDFRARKFSEVGFDYNTYWDVEYYNAVGQTAPVIIIYSEGGGALDMSDPWFVLDSINQALTEDGVEVMQLRGYQNNRETTLTVELDGLIKTIQDNNYQKGDILYVSKDTNNNLVAVKRGVTPYAKTENADNSYLHLGILNGTSEGNNNELMGGRVLEIYSTHIFCATGGSLYSDEYTASRPFSPLPKTVYLYDGATDRLRTVSSGEIMVGDIIVERSIYDGVQEIMIYRNIL